MDVRGRIRELTSAPLISDGFRMLVDGPDGQVNIEVLTYNPVHLDCAAGAAVRIRAKLGDERSLRLDDESGNFFYLFNGTMPPQFEDLPILLRQSGRRAYFEVSTSDDLCRWTSLNKALEIVASGAHLGVVDPGYSATVETSGRSFKVTSAIASTPDESDCGREGTSRLAFFFSRLPWTQRPSAK
jgi:hypothetical protein